MARLYRGWRSTKEKEQETRSNSGATQDRAAQRRQQYNAYSPRESDWDAYEQFRDRHGINGEA